VRKLSSCHCGQAASVDGGMDGRDASSPSTRHSHQPGSMVTHNHLEVLARNHFCIEPGIPTIESQGGCLRKLCGRRNHDDVLGAYAAHDRRAQMLIASAEHETLRSDGAAHQLAIAIAIEKGKDLALREVGADDFARVNGIDAEKSRDDAAQAEYRAALEALEASTNAMAGLAADAPEPAPAGPTAAPAQSGEVRP